MQSQFSILFFASMFVCGMFEVEVEHVSVKQVLSVSFLLLPIYIFTSYEQSSSRHMMLKY